MRKLFIQLNTGCIVLNAISRATSLVWEGTQWMQESIVNSSIYTTIVKSPTHAMYAFKLGRFLWTNPMQKIEPIEIPHHLANEDQQQTLTAFVQDLHKLGIFFDFTKEEKVFIDTIVYKKLELDENLEEEHCKLLSQLSKKYSQSLYDLKLQNAHISFFSGLYLQGNVIEALASGNPITNALSTGLDDFKKAAQYYYHDKPIHAYEALFNGLKSIVMSAAPFAALLQAGLSNHQTMVAVLSLHVAIFLKWHNKLIDFKKIFTKDRQQTLYNYYLALMEGKLTKAERIAKELLTKHQLDVNDFSLLSEIEEVAITHVREQMLNILVRGLLNNIQKCQRSSAQNFATFDRSLRSAKYLKEQTKYIKRLQPFVDLTANNDAELDNLIKKTNKPAVQGLFQQLKHARHQSAITSLSQPTRFQVPHLKKQLANNKQIGKELNILLENYTYTSELYKDIYAVMSQLKQTDPFKFLSFQRKIAECDPLLSLKIFQNLTDQNSEMVYCNQDTLSTCLQQLDNYALLQDPFYEQECTQIFGQLLKQPHLQNAFKQSLMQASKTLQENLLGIAQKYKAKALYLCITDALNTSTSRAMAGCK